MLKNSDILGDIAETVKAEILFDIAGAIRLFDFVKTVFCKNFEDQQKLCKVILNG